MESIVKEIKESLEKEKKDYTKWYYIDYSSKNPKDVLFYKRYSESPSELELKRVPNTIFKNECEYPFEVNIHLKKEASEIYVTFKVTIYTDIRYKREDLEKISLKVLSSIFTEEDSKFNEGLCRKLKFKPIPAVLRTPYNIELEVFRIRGLAIVSVQGYFKTSIEESIKRIQKLTNNLNEVIQYCEFKLLK